MSTPPTLDELTRREARAFIKHYSKMLKSHNSQRESSELPPYPEGMGYNYKTLTEPTMGTPEQQIEFLGSAPELSPRTIRTTFIHPPIPMRQFDWVAYYYGEEEDGPTGWGRTEEEAIADLKEQAEPATIEERQRIARNWEQYEAELARCRQEGAKMRAAKN